MECGLNLQHCGNLDEQSPGLELRLLLPGILCWKETEWKGNIFAPVFICWMMDRVSIILCNFLKAIRRA